jgi:hypothetical protein
MGTFKGNLASGFQHGGTGIIYFLDYSIKQMKANILLHTISI